MKRFLGLLSVLLYVSVSAAAERPVPGRVDHRVRSVDYHAEQVYAITAFFGYHVTIVFARGERVEKISAGYADAWEIKSYGNYITVQPKDSSPATNLVVTTDLRMYVFDLLAKLPTANVAAASYARDPDQIFALRFKYPDEERAIADQARANAELARRMAEAVAAEQATRSTVVAQAPAKPRNSRYTYQGTDAIAPYEAWDDGTFTYLRFFAQQDLPTPFVVNDDGTEGTTNKHFDGDVMVIQRVAKHFVLRKGHSVVCIFNDNPAAHTAQPTSGTTEPGAERGVK